MSSHPPPVPPEQRPRRGDEAVQPEHEKQPEGYRPQDRNLKEQGRQGNVNENTHNKGYQQDR